MHPGQHFANIHACVYFKEHIWVAQDSLSCLQNPLCYVNILLSDKRKIFKYFIDDKLKQNLQQEIFAVALLKFAFHITTDPTRIFPKTE